MLSRSPNTAHLIFLTPHGMAGFALTNGSMSSNQSGEGDIRRALIEADYVDCRVALPSQLFYSTQIPSASASALKTKTPTPNRPKQTHFVVARN